MRNKAIALVLVMAALLQLAFLPASQRFTSEGPFNKPMTTDTEIIFERLELVIDEVNINKGDDATLSYIKRYFSSRRRDAEILLGKSAMYLPMIEDYLRANNLPDELKYIPLVESALNPRAISQKGAVGLWQMMPRTGRVFGLKIDKYVDERRDPHKSTQAALRYLADLYEEYDDWALAIAAYNCGTPRMNKAIRFAQSKNFWEVKNYLPRETQKYVPKIMAAAYMINFYPYHDIEPDYINQDLLFTETVMVYEKMNLKDLIAETGIPARILYKLNPAFRGNIIPASEEGYHLIVPRTFSTAVKNLLYPTGPEAPEEVNPES
jgi:membrane-bound lytic murein transglycosylase D